MDNKRCHYIVFEGIDGVGKSTQMQILAKRLNQEFPKKNIVTTLEPGGTVAGNLIRQQVLNGNIRYSSLEEFRFMTTARSYLYEEVLHPKLNTETIILSDRNWLSSLAYQGHDIIPDYIVNISAATMHEFAYPDLLLYFDANKPLRRSCQGGDTFERRDDNFYYGVIERYRRYNHLFNSQTIIASQGIDQISTLVLDEALKIIQV